MCNFYIFIASAKFYEQYEFEPSEQRMNFRLKKKIIQLVNRKLSITIGKNLQTNSQFYLKFGIKLLRIKDQQHFYVLIYSNFL